MQIREAIKIDLDQLIELWLELFQYHEKQHPVFELKNQDREHIGLLLVEKIDMPNGRFFVAEHQGVLIGMLICRYIPGSELFLLSKKGYIGETIITRSYRGKGIGKELYMAAEAWLLSMGADHIELQVSVHNKRTSHFWEELGFTASTQHLIKQL